MSTDLIVFLSVSAAIAILSRNSLRDRHSYGYYRFFGFEFVLLLLVSNAPFWFENPLSSSQVLSWFSLAVSGCFVASGFYSLKSVGKFSLSSGDTVELVKSGIYRYIRHPLYSSLLFLAVGAFLKLPSLFGTILMVGAVISFVTAAKTEEVLNAKKFNNRYLDYMKQTKMFVPFLF